MSIPADLAPSELERRQRRLAVAGLLVLKLCIVLVAVQALPEGPYNVNQLPDSYPQIARNLLDGNGYRVRPETTPTMIRPPVNIFLLAGVFSLFGESLVAVQILNVFLTVAGGLLLMSVARRHIGNPFAAWIAGIGYMLHPGMMLAESRGGVEVPITFLMVFFVYLLDRAFASRRVRDFVLAGVALGVTGLTKSTPVAVGPFLLLYAWFRGSGEDRIRLCRNVVVLGVATALVLAPWVIRNYAISGHLVPSMTIKGAAAYQGLHLSRTGLQGGEFYEALDLSSREQKAMAAEMGFSFWPGNMLPLFYTPEDEVEFDSRLFAYVVVEYRNHPELFVKNVAQNAWRFWIQGKTQVSTTLNAIVTVPLLAIALVGVYLSFRRRLGLGHVVLFCAVYYLSHLPLVAFAKYHVPLIPYLALFASVAIHRPVASLLESVGLDVDPISSSA